MKKTIPYFFWVVFLFMSTLGHAQKATVKDLYVYMTDGKVDAYPRFVLKAQEKTATQLKLTLNNDSLITYELNDIVSFSDTLSTEFPHFTSYKFNNKYNENVYTDAYATIGKDDSIKVVVAAIGKRLTPSFKVSAPDVKVYVGDSLQSSKVTRLRFDRPIHYTVTRPGLRKMAYSKIKDEEWSEGSPGGPIYEPIPLTPQMLSTNHLGYEFEGLDKMIDGDESTFFHSAYGDHAEAPYVVVHLDQPVNAFVLKYTTRPDRPDYCPLQMIIECSHDGNTWNSVRTLEPADGIPTQGYAEKYTSPNIQLDGDYEYLRFTVPAVEHKNRKYFVLAEFSLQKYLGESEPSGPELISPAIYNYVWKPFGRNYVVDVDWLTDADTARVPRIDINLMNGKTINSINKERYLYASIRFDGGNVFPNLAVDSVSVRGRGNSTWHGTGGKNPYRLKFNVAVKPFGMTKGKNWVLLANAMHGAMLTNAIGMKIARMAGTAAANDIVPVELYINGDYRGSYNLTQHVGFHNNSVDIDETNAFLLEMDINRGDSDPYFYNSSYQIKTNIKEPDFSELPLGSVLTRQKIEDEFNRFSLKLAGNEDDLENLYDARMLARYFLVNELIQNEELMHPKSCFLYREDVLAMHSKYIFGPVWDLDWAYGYEHGYRHCPSNYSFDYFRGLEDRWEPGGLFFVDLRRREAVDRAYYQVWTDFMRLHLEELGEFIDDYYAFASPSINNNVNVKSSSNDYRDYNDYSEVATRFKNWLNNRAKHIYANLTPYDLSQPVPVTKGDVNKDGWITMADVIALQNHLFALENASFDEGQADANADGEISIVDLVWIVAWAMEAESDYDRYHSLPAAEAALGVQTFTAALGCTSAMPVSLNIEKGGYAATQFDVVLPQNMELETVALPESWTNCQVESQKQEDGRYRVAVYSQNGTPLPWGRSDLNLMVKAHRNVAVADRVISLGNVLLVTSMGEDERLSGKSTQFDMEVTGIEDTHGTEAVRGGDALYIEALTAGEVKVYATDGRWVKRCPVHVGANRIELPTGVYIVNQQKVIVHK